MESLNLYKLIRAWYEFKHENKLTGNHTDVYMFLVDLHNRLAWKSTIAIPIVDASDFINMSSNTFRKCLSDFEMLNIVKVVKRAKNQFAANEIDMWVGYQNLLKLSRGTCAAFVKASERQLVTHLNHRYTIQTLQSNTNNTNIDLNDNLNLIPENSQNEFQATPEPQLNLIESKPESKPKAPKEPKPKKEPKITEGTKEIVEQWYKQNNKTLYYTGKEAKAMVLICAKISNLINVNGKECNDTTIRDSLRLLLENVAKIDTWIYDNFNLSLFASKIETLADKMKNGQTAAPKFVSKEDERKAHNAELQRQILQKIATHIAENPNNPVH